MRSRDTTRPRWSKVDVGGRDALHAIRKWHAASEPTRRRYPRVEAIHDLVGEGPRLFGSEQSSFLMERVDGSRTKARAPSG